MSSNLRQIGPLTALTILFAALKRHKNDVHSFSVAINPILFIVGGNTAVHINIFHEFEFRQHGTTDYGINV